MIHKFCKFFFLSFLITFFDFSYAKEFRSQGNAKPEYRGLGLSSELLPLIFDNTKNTVFSPLGLETSLVYLGIGASGQTRSQIFEFLEIDNTPQAIKQRRLDIRDFRRGSDDFLSFFGLATDQGGINTNYKDAISKDLSANFLKLTLDSINTWSSEPVNGKFGYPLGFLSPSTSSLFFSLNNFELQFEVYSDETPNSRGSFYVAKDLLSLVSYFTVQGNVVLLRADAFSCVSFVGDDSPYKVYILIPNPESSLDELVGRVDRGFLESIFREIDSKVSTKSKVLIPSFTVKSNISLAPSLSLLGLSHVFSSPDAQFPRISSNGFYLDDLHQLSRVSFQPKTNGADTDDYGITSKFVKAIQGGIGKSDKKEGLILNTSVVDVNRPFLFFVLDQNSSFVLMTGAIVNPALEN